MTPLPPPQEHLKNLSISYDMTSDERALVKEKGWTFAKEE